MTADEIVNILSSKPAEQWITLVEGLRVEEMAEKLNSQFRILASRSEQNSEFLQLPRGLRVRPAVLPLGAFTSLTALRIAPRLAGRA